MEKIKVIAVNGSPRKNFNTAELLKHFSLKHVMQQIHISSQIIKNTTLVCGMNQQRNNGNRSNSQKIVQELLR